jgi:hypothetical protein
MKGESGQDRGHGIGGLSLERILELGMAAERQEVRVEGETGLPGGRSCWR